MAKNSNGDQNQYNKTKLLKKLKIKRLKERDLVKVLTKLLKKINLKKGREQKN